MAKIKILSPVASGNGACVIHAMLEENIRNYHLIPYNPYLTLFPPSLYFSGRSKRADVIHTTPDYAIFHARKSVPLILTFHGYVLDQYMWKYSNLLQSIHYKTNLLYQTKKALPKAKIITAVSRFIANIVTKELDQDIKIRTIYNGIDENRFIPRRVGIINNSKNIKVLIAGHVSVKKGSRWVNDIIENLDQRISISYTTGLASSRKQLMHPRLTCLGSIPYSEMPSLYQKFDILLFPTVREGFGLVAAEAMSCGLPVVATDCASLPELVIHGKGGYLCKLGDVTDFSDKLNLLAENLSLRREMGAFNRAMVEQKFTLSRMIRDYEEVFEEAVS